MPSAPELTDAACEIRTVKILHQLKAKHLCRADGYRRIPCKITVNLYGKQHRRHDDIHSSILRIIPIDRIDNHCHPVCHHQLQEKSPEHDKQPLPHIVIVIRVRLIDLPEQILRALNRSCHQLRKKGHKQRVHEKIALGSDIPAIHIHRVAQRLKRIEGNPDRQKQIKRGLWHGKPNLREDKVEQVHCKIKIFEKKQHPDIEHKARSHCRLLSPLCPGALNHNAAQIRHACRKQQ